MCRRDTPSARFLLTQKCVVLGCLTKMNGREDVDFIENIQSKRKRILLKKLDKSL